MNSRFVSLDIETLGLGMHAPIIEFGAVVADWLTGEIVDTFHTYVWHSSYDNCEPYAMSMHPTILRRIAVEESGYEYVHIDDLAATFGRYLAGRDWLPVAGKNVGGFDLPRLRAQCKDWDKHTNFPHQVIDPGMLFWNPVTDEVPPNSTECLRRCGLDTEVSHTALEDAMDVVRMIITYVGRNVKPLSLIESIQDSGGLNDS